MIFVHFEFGIAVTNRFAKCKSPPTIALNRKEVVGGATDRCLSRSSDRGTRACVEHARRLSRRPRPFRQLPSWSRRRTSQRYPAPAHHGVSVASTQRRSQRAESLPSPRRDPHVLPV